MDEEIEKAEVCSNISMNLPEISQDPMEFLSRSWSVSALEVSRTVAPMLVADAIPEDIDGEDPVVVVGNNFSFATSATSQLVLERIMSQSEVSPLTLGRLSHSSGSLNGGGSLSDSPPVSPSDLEDAKYPRTITPAKQPYTRTGVGTTRTVGRWFKDRRVKKKEETRAHNAQLHAAVSVAALASAVAAIAAATAATGNGKNGWAVRTDMAVASAATLVAAQCVEAAEAMGVERERLASVVGSAVGVRTPGDIVTLTAAAATALRGAATLKARAMKEVWNVAAVIPVEKGGLGSHHQTHYPNNELRRKNLEGDNDEEVTPDENFLGLCSQELLARGTELLKRTRKGSLHWKLVAVYINQMGQVMLKTKSRHVGGTITKKKKSVIIDICKEVLAWPGRHLLEGGEQRCYFGLKTAEHRVIEFECRSQREYEMWTQGVSRLLCIINNGERTRKSGS